ncbi:S8 family serine peptidase [candidate division KSB1 bacterium]|nr:S8 family serine peptidase [candidate division KSB1 bacterium]
MNTLRIHIIVILLVAFSLFGQSLPAVHNNSWQFRNLKDSKTVTWSASENSDVEYIHLAPRDTVVTAILSFRMAPLVFSEPGRANSLLDEHAQFFQVLSSAQTYSAQNTRQAPVDLLHDYYTAFNGVAVKGSLVRIKQLAKLPMVSGYSLERTFRITLNESVKQIQADRVVHELGYDGSGVLVGLIDTGIDYRITALGGGIGPGYRITGGYDFVDDDADPMDDIGHGTHVAGIIGAKSDSLTGGVAPGVRMLAVKALNEKGVGLESDILAAIEYCLDPDDNPLTDDGVDIINMSFGGPPKAFDPVITAAENATRAGVLCVATAGNAGESGEDDNSFETIYSPAAGANVLAVGSCGPNFERSFFSSKGPTAYTALIKPEALAPGEQITSLWLNNATHTLDGTSMAAPFATGAAALLKQQRPEWSPQQLKAAIVNGCGHVDPAESPYSVGNGCINTWSSATCDFTVSPGILNFSPIVLDKPVWSDTLSFTVGNHGSQNRTIKLSVESPNPGLQLDLSAVSLSIAPGGFQTVQAVLQVSQSGPIQHDNPYSYTGTIHCTSGNDSVRAPFGAIMSNVLVLDFDDSPGLYVLYSPDTKTCYTKHPRYGEKIFTHRLPTGKYNVFALFEEFTVNQDTFVCYYGVEHSDINTAGFRQELISREEAVWPAWDPVKCISGVADEKDVLYQSFRIALRRGFEEDFYAIGIGDSEYKNKIFVSKLSKNIRIVTNIIAGPGENPFILDPFTIGVENLTDVQPDYAAADFEQFFINIDPSKPDPDYFGLGMTFISTVNSNPVPYSNFYSFSGPAPSGIRLLKASTKMDTAFFRHLGIGSFEVIHELLTYDWGGNFRLQEDGRLLCYEKPYRPPFVTGFIYNFYALPGDTLDFSRLKEVLLPVFCVKRTYTEQGSAISIDNTYYQLNHDFRGVINQRGFRSMWSPEEMYSCMFLDKGVKRPPFFTGSTPSTIYYPVRENSFYRLFGSTIPYFLLGQGGVTTFDFSFGFNLGIPCIDLFQVQADGKPANFVSPGQDGLVRFIPWDWSDDITDVSLALMPASGEKIDLPAQKTGREYQAVIPDSLPHEYIDVLAFVKDANSSQLDVRMRPGFFFGETKNEIKFYGHLLVDSYELLNDGHMPFTPGDTLLFALKLKSFGSEDLENVTVTFPEHDKVTRLGEKSKTFSRFSPGDSIDIELQFLLTFEQSAENQIVYTIPMQWTSNGTQFRRSFDMYIYTGFSTGIAQNNAKPALCFQLNNNYPNPFNEKTTLKFTIPESGHVLIEIFNINGQRVNTLLDRLMPAGDFQLKWDGLDNFQNPVSSGLYLYRIRFADKQLFGKTIVLR